MIQVWDWSEMDRNAKILSWERTVLYMMIIMKEFGFPCKRWKLSLTKETFKKREGAAFSNSKTLKCIFLKNQKCEKEFPITKNAKLKK